MFPIKNPNIRFKTADGYVVLYKGYEIILQADYCSYQDNALYIEVEHALEQKLIGLVSEQEMKEDVLLSFEIQLNTKDIDIWSLLT